VNTVLRLVLLGAATCFVIGLHLMNRPSTARRGSLLSSYGMAAAVAATVVELVREGTVTTTGWIVLATGTVLGTTVGWYLARTVAMTAVPQVVSLFNAAGGGAAMLVAVYEFLRVDGTGDRMAAGLASAVVVDVVIGAVTFSGSLIASGKLQGVVASRPVTFPGVRVLAAALAIVAVAGGGLLVVGRGGPAVLAVVAVTALAFGVVMVMPIGGADMPVVISLLNALTGTAVAMAGIVIGNTVLIIAGALVGASGGILTMLMAEAMNRSLVSIVVGGFGTGDAPSGAIAAGAGDARVRSVSAEDAAIQLAYASRVIIVPGYGLAAAQAQHEVRELAEMLETRGVDVCYAIHPVAGRLPGHMNVLLAEANVPYRQLKEMDEVNPEFARADVALVVGANDVVNPAARRPGNPVSGMPILDVDQARSVIVIKRSMGHGYAGIDNELYTNPKTGMFFADAKRGLADLAAAVKSLVGS
jgi:NAD(P) transhydrogenase subunit beta